MMKRVLLAIAAGMLAVYAFAGFRSAAGTGKKTGSTAIVVEAAETDTAEAADSDWYNKALTDPDLTSQYSYYKMIDVNKDGVPVLIMSTTDQSFIGDEDRACLIVNSDGEPKIVKEIGGNAGECFYYNPGEQYITYFSRLAGEGHYAVCQVKDGELNVVKTLDYYAPHHNPDEDSDKAINRIDGVDVSEGVFENATKEYAKEEFAVTYEAIK